MLLTCPHCRAELELDPQAAGQAASCPYCRGAFQAPLRAGPEVPLSITPAVATHGDAEPVSNPGLPSS